MTRTGLSLVETIMVVAIVGLIALIATPRLADPLDRLAVERAAADLVGAHARARFAAVARGRTAILRVRADTLEVALVGQGDTTRLWSGPGPAIDGVALEGPSRPIVFSPVGLSTGLSNARWTLRRGDRSMSVVTSRLGRVRVER